jgi:hypothetical protein
MLPVKKLNALSEETPEHLYIEKYSFSIKLQTLLTHSKRNPFFPFHSSLHTTRHSLQVEVRIKNKNNAGEKKGDEKSRIVIYKSWGYNVFPGHHHNHPVITEKVGKTIKKKK